MPSTPCAQVQAVPATSGTPGADGAAERESDAHERLRWLAELASRVAHSPGPSLPGSVRFEDTTSGYSRSWAESPCFGSRSYAAATEVAAIGGYRRERNSYLPDAPPRSPAAMMAAARTPELGLGLGSMAARGAPTSSAPTGSTRKNTWKLQKGAVAAEQRVREQIHSLLITKQAALSAVAQL
jgi:hypothetical protein